MKKAAPTDVIDDIIAIWHAQGYSDFEICWMLTAWDLSKIEQ